MRIINKNSQKGVLSLIFFLSFLFTPIVSAQEGRVPSPPTFPRCEDKLSGGRGDYTSIDSGVHGIPGRGNLEGKDDVYTLTDGNYAQCYCPLTAGTGIQSNWWYIEGLPLGRVDIDAYKRDGWLYETNGKDWNLMEGEYLIKNTDFQCSGGRSTATPTPTSRVTATPAPTTSSKESSCSSLVVSPSSGTAPLTVRFTANGNDPKGDIKEYEFNFGDNSDNQDQVVKQTDKVAAHRYVNPGTYTATVEIKDSEGNWKGNDSTCKKTITVRERPGVMGTTDSEELPETGAPLSLFFGFMILGEIGYILYKRYQIV